MIDLTEEKSITATLKQKIAESPIMDIAVEITVGVSVVGIAGLAFKAATWILHWIESL